MDHVIDAAEIVNFIVIQFQITVIGVGNRRAPRLGTLARLEHVFQLLASGPTTTFNVVLNSPGCPFFILYPRSFPPRHTKVQLPSGNTGLLGHLVLLSPHESEAVEKSGCQRDHGAANLEIAAVLMHGVRSKTNHVSWVSTIGDPHRHAAVRSM